MTIEPGSLDPWRDVPAHGLTAGFFRAWSPRPEGLSAPEPHRVLLVRLALQPGVIRICLPPDLAEPIIDETIQPVSSAKQQGTRWLQRLTRLAPGTLSPWRPLSRADVPQSRRTWYGPGGALAKMSLQATPAGVLLECRGQAAGSRRQTDPFLAILPFAAEASVRGEAWLEEIHASLVP